MRSVLPVPGPLRPHLGGGSGKRGAGAYASVRVSASRWKPSLVMATPQVATIVNANQAFEKNLFASIKKPVVSIRGRSRASPCARQTVNEYKNSTRAQSKGYNF